METGLVLEICREALKLILILSLPALGASLVIGLMISIFQATTQIQEQTLTFVPKMVVVFAVMAITSGWTLDLVRRFSVQLLEKIPEFLANMH